MNEVVTPQTAEQHTTNTDNQQWVIAALYQFHPVSFPADLRNRLQELSAHLQLRGTLIVADEGINGTVAGNREGIDELHQVLLNEGFTNMEYKESFSKDKPFKRMKVKLKHEIVTLGVDVEPLAQVGHYLNPEEWHKFIQQEDVVVVDTRNRYEYAAGTFKNAIDPNTETFREFPAFVDEHLSDAKHKKIAMFCTGGIRCEKSTSLLLQQGFEEVYHLKGGILNYLNTIPEEESLWKGECFVFDGRVGVGHGVEEGESAMCFGCGWPLKRHELQSVKFERGVSCPHCYDQTSEAQKARYRMRQKQMDGEI